MRRAICLFILSVAVFVPSLYAEDQAADKTLSLNDGKLTMAAPTEWVKKQPRTRIVEVEMAVTAAEGDEQPGRVTIMGAGGSVEANIDRWIGQFRQPDSGSTRERAKIEETKVAGQVVHRVDIPGTFKDQRGPFAPATMREGYRMLAAIIVTDGAGQYFVKLTGPAKTVAANEKAFDEMIKSLQVKDSE